MRRIFIYSPDICATATIPPNPGVTTDFSYESGESSFTALSDKYSRSITTANDGRVWRVKTRYRKQRNSAMFDITGAVIYGLIIHVPSLLDRREHLAREFFKSIPQLSSCLLNLFPTTRDPSIITRLRSANKFPRIPTRTRKYQTCSILLPIGTFLNFVCLFVCLTYMRCRDNFSTRLLLLLFC